MYKAYGTFVCVYVYAYGEIKHLEILYMFMCMN